MNNKYSEERMFPKEPYEEPLDFVYLWLKQYEEHVARYNFFGEYAENNCILDAGCGFGYGVKILTFNNPTMAIGIDNSISSLKYAKKNYFFNNTSYIVTDAIKTPFADKTFDTIYAFELIEHMKDADVFLSEMVRILKDDGNIFISTPNKKLSGYENGSKVNRFHFREYELEEFRTLLEKYFNDVRIYGEKYSKRYLITESNLHSIIKMREKIIGLEKEIFDMKFQLDRLHIELVKNLIPKKIQDLLYKLLKKIVHRNHNSNDVINYTLFEKNQIEPLISVAPLQHEIVITPDNLAEALYFISACKNKR